MDQLTSLSRESKGVEGRLDVSFCPISGKIAVTNLVNQRSEEEGCQSNSKRARVSDDAKAKVRHEQGG